ncbi:hypothetical protein P4O66_006069, partial [Electrophorus voltai]
PCLIVKAFIPCVSAGCMLQGNLRRDYITAYTGDSVLLPCSCTDPHAKPESFTWKKRNTSSKTWDVITSESEQYRNRVQMGTAHSPGNLSLLISHLTQEDKGVYRCYLNQWNYKAIRLTIKGCSLSENQKTDDITAYTGDSVLLPCSCIDPHAKPENITWRKHNTNRNTWDVITSESEQYRNRVQLGTVHSPGNLSLLISHLTEEDKGDYRCSLTNQKYKDIRLTVKGKTLFLIQIQLQMINPALRFSYLSHVKEKRGEKSKEMKLKCWDMHMRGLMVKVFYWCVSAGCTLEHQKITEVTAFAGDSVLLPCSCTDPQTRPESFTWQKHQNSSYTEISSESEQYRNRVQLGTAHSPGNFSLLISHLTEEDEGDYRCQTKGNTHKDIKLYVSVCKDIVNPPTVLSGYVGGSVLLPCSCTKLLAKPKTIRWSFIEDSNVIYSTDQTKHYTGRIKMVAAPGNFSLFISGLTKEDEGKYMCSISIHHTTVNLNVK